MLTMAVFFREKIFVMVIVHLQSLRSSDKVSLKLTDIGVITPYRKQVCTTNLSSLVLNSHHTSSIGKL